MQSAYKKKEPRPPNYKEAYPQLDIVRGLAGLRHGRTVCVFTDWRGRRVGLLWVAVDPDRTVAVVEGDIAGPFFTNWRGLEQFALVPTANRVDRKRRLLSCPECQRRVRTLVRTDSWKCPRCTRLRYRSQLVGPATVWAEQLEELDKELKQGRPKHRHQSTHDQMVERQRRLRQQLRKTPARQAAAEHCKVVSAEWHTVDEVWADGSLAAFDRPDPPDDWIDPVSFEEAARQRRDRRVMRFSFDPPEDDL